MSRILECLRSKFEDFTHKKSITRQINQIHCFKGAHLTLSQIQFEGAHLRILQCNPKNAKSLHLPDLRQKRVCYQSNVPPQTALCLHPWPGYRGCKIIGLGTGQPRLGVEFRSFYPRPLKSVGVPLPQIYGLIGPPKSA